MVAAQTTKFSEFILKLGDGGAPEVFAKPCGLTSRSANFSAETSSTRIPDCDDEDAPSWDEKVVTGMSAEIPASGVMDDTAWPIYWEWFRSGAAKNIQLAVAKAAPNGGHWEGAAVLSSLEFQAEKDNGTVEVSMTIQNSGQWTWVATV